MRTVLASGAPASEVARIASEQAAELVVAGTHGLTGLERAVLGSFTEEFVRHLRCAVLVIREPQGGED